MTPNHFRTSWPDDGRAIGAWARRNCRERAGFEPIRFVRRENPSTLCRYRKGDKQFHRDTLGALAKSFGLEPVSLVAIDDTWSALRVKRT